MFDLDRWNFCRQTPIMEGPSMDDDAPATIRFPTPAKRPRKPRAAPTADDAPTVSAELALLRKRLLAEQAGLEAVGGRAYEITLAIESTRAEIAALGRRAPKELRKRLESERAEMVRVGFEAGRAEKRIEATLAEIAAAGRGK